jgi:hypothetical protein
MPPLTHLLGLPMRIAQNEAREIPGEPSGHETPEAMFARLGS